LVMVGCNEGEQPATATPGQAATDTPAPDTATPAK
jgi:hypothetical protein